MKTKSNFGLIALAASIFLIASAAGLQAEWRVDIESKNAVPGQLGVTVDITGYWDYSLGSLTIPLVVREIDPGSFWTGDLPYDTNGMAGYHPHTHGVTWNWEEPWAVLMEELLPQAPQAPCAAEEDIGYDAVSPDHFCVNAVGTPGSGGSFVPAKPNGFPFVTIAFDVTENVGQFEIDTACVSAVLNEIYLCEFFVMEPGGCCFGPSGGLGEFCPGNEPFTFTKGIITIAPCDCGLTWGDVTGDTEVTPLDVSYMVNYVYRNRDGRVLPLNCPRDCGDVNCDDTITPLDIAFYVAYVYHNYTPFPCGSPCQ